ncbi:LMWPc-domain-containing protein [Saitoella complicata NRRL Y-17804]|nr:LMWPc-domain-containing protein [Saitoella complicata NRRL Y-17804]ODQ54655.1 LMWPc-domain-containing protein [Saitoella complicata NRRL Y-17804]
MPQNDQISVLFVCLGNICRSPMSEAVFKHTVKELGLEDRFSRIDSCGTAAYHVGEAPDPRSVSTCESHGVPVNHYARQIRQKDFTEFDYVLCMDRSNLSDLQRVKPRDGTAVVKLFGEYGEKGEKRIVDDPYYGGIDGFEVNFQQAVGFSKGFLKEVLKVNV